MLRTSSLLAPLAGALLIASPAIGQTDDRPGSHQRYAHDRNADDGEDARQGARYADRDDYRNAVPDEAGESESYAIESRRPDEHVEHVAREEEGVRPRPGAYPAAPVHWNDRDQRADAPTAYRPDPSQPAAWPQREQRPPTGAEGTGMSPVTPARAMGGAYSVPRRNYSPAEAIWHVRAALNVAALGCRDANEARTVAAYNGLLSSRRAALAAADARTKALYRARFGGRWQYMHDTAMTKLYNFFAQPPAHDGFCRVARQILDEAQTVPDAAFAMFANDALMRLEAPFTDRQNDAHRAPQESWQGATS